MKTLLQTLLQTLLRRGAVAAALVLLGTSPVLAQSEGETVITDITIEGAQRIAPATVITYSTLAIGDSIDAADLNRSLGRLFATNLFEDVAISLDGSVVTIEVLENPIINRIALEGNSVLSDERLLQFLDIQPRRVFTDKVALDTKELLMEIYRQSGRYAAVIEPKIIRLPDRRVDLVFEIDEGPLIKITEIKFIGNQAFSDRRLKNAIASREARWYTFLATNDKYDSNRLALDSQQLRQFYLQNGYADIEIIRATGELLPDRSGFVLSFQVEEGAQYTIDAITINSEIAELDTAALMAELTLASDEIYDIRVLEESLLALTNAIGEFGYAFVAITPEITLDSPLDNTGAASLDIALNISPATRNYIEEINIRGNDRTLDSVIRRRFELVEGDSFNQLRLVRSERNVRNLGYFSDVNMTVLPGSAPDQSVIDMEVVETTTGSLSLGIGYSTLNDVSLKAGINERNFLGTGRAVRADLDISGNSSDFRAGITEPFFLDRNLTGRFDIFRESNTFTGARIKRQGIDLGVGFSAADDFYHRIGYVLAGEETTPRRTRTQIRDPRGSRILSEVSYAIGRDTRDSSIDPTSGYWIELRESIAGLGGDTRYSRTVLRGQYFVPLYFNTFVLGFDGQVGTIQGLDQDILRANHFILGGRQLRGFNSAGIGPRDEGDNSAVGGKNYYSFSANLISDYGLNPDLNMRWTVFMDSGALWGTDYAEVGTDGLLDVRGAEDSVARVSVGFGLLWDTVLGPMSFMWGFPVEKQDYDQTRNFQFSFGTRF